MSGSNDEKASGIPMRVVHESYVEMLNAMRRYYRADQEGSKQTRKRAQSNLQHKILSFYEVLRPYLKKKSGGKKYWEGEIPDYDDDSGTAVLRTQTKRVPIPTEKLPDEWQDKKMSWLEEQIKNVDPSLNGNSRIGDIHHEEEQGVLLLLVKQYQAGLKHLEDKYDMTVKRIERGSEYLRHHKNTRSDRRSLNIDLLMRAARSLEEAADDMGALAELSMSTPQTEITEEMLEEVEEWRQENLT